MNDTLLTLFTPWDLAALALLIFCQVGMTYLIERQDDRNPSFSVLMGRHRAQWMREVAARDVRIVDAQLVASLRAGTAFFASTVLIAVGGLAALIGQADQLVSLSRDLGASPVVVEAEAVWEAKLVVALVILVNAFLKFVWSNRLFGYVTVLVGAMPPCGGDKSELEAYAARSTALNQAAARSFNRGLRGVYFTIALMAWFVGPLFLAIATLATSAMLYRREFLSISRQAML